MTGRIEGGNCIATITFTEGAAPEVSSAPAADDKAIIAALVEALEGSRATICLSRFVIEQIQNSETMALSINAEIRAINAALKLAGA